MAIVTININEEKWLEYYPANLNRSKKWSWFRWETDFFTHPILSELDPAERWLWPYLISITAKQQRPHDIKINTRSMSSVLQLSEEQIFWTLNFLADHEMIKIGSAPPKAKEPQDAEQDPVPQLELMFDNEEQKQDIEEEPEACDNLATNLLQENANPVSKLSRYVRTDDTYATYNPPYPPSRGATGRKQLDAIAEVAYVAAVGARRDCLDEPEAKARIGPQGWELLAFEFRDWEGFCTAFNREWRAGYESRFRRATLAGWKNLLRLRADQQPKLQLVSGERS